MRVLYNTYIQTKNTIKENKMTISIIDTIRAISFDDMTEEQKSNAIEYMRDIENRDTTPYWSTELCDNLKERLDSEYGIYNADIQWSGFSCQGDGASISTEYNIDIEKFLRKCKAWSKFRSLHRFIKANELIADIGRHSGRYAHSNMVFANVSFEWGIDFNYTQETVSVALECFITEKIREMSNELYRDLEKENDYHLSDDALTDLIQANDYTFKVNEAGKVLGLA